MVQYWFDGETGGTVSGPFHKGRDCSELDGRGRPVQESVLELDSVELCPECNPLSIDSDGDSGTCTEVMDNGEVCGRDLPCRYHSD